MLNKQLYVVIAVIETNTMTLSRNQNIYISMSNVPNLPTDSKSKFSL